MQCEQEGVAVLVAITVSESDTHSDEEHGIEVDGSADLLAHRVGDLFSVGCQPGGQCTGRVLIEPSDIFADNGLQKALAQNAELTL
jgi:hypothetical protein